MRASVHLVDGRVGSGFSAARRRPTPADTPGLLEARSLIAAPLSGALLPVPQPSRFGLVAFWVDDAAIDRFEQEHPLAGKIAEGWSTRLEPLRAVPHLLALGERASAALLCDHDDRAQRGAAP